MRKLLSQVESSESGVRKKKLKTAIRELRKQLATLEAEKLGDAKQLQQLIVAGRNMGLVKVADIVGASALGSLKLLYPHSLIRDAVDCFVTGAHRVPIINNEGETVGVFSQSSLIQWLAENLSRPAMSYLGCQTLSELSLAGAQVYSIKQDESVLEALKSMYLHRCSAVAVVDNDDGRLVGTISTHDLKTLFPDKLHYVVKPSLKFLKEHSPLSLHCATVAPTTNILTTAKLMSLLHIHRVWIVNPKGQPIGVVSMRDILEVVRSTAGDNGRVEPDAAYSSGTLYQLLAGFSVQDALVRSRHDKKEAVITLTKTNTVAEAIKILSKNEILSAPIVDARTGICLGMIDMLDIVVHVLAVVPESVEKPSPLGQLMDPTSIQENELRDLVFAGRNMAEELV